LRIIAPLRAVHLKKGDGHWQERHLPPLDSLRGIGVILIFADHFTNPVLYTRLDWAMDIFRVLRLPFYRRIFKNEGIVGRALLRPVLCQMSLPNAAGLCSVLHDIGRALLCISARVSTCPSLGSYWIYIVTFTFNFCPISVALIQRNALPNGHTADDTGVAHGNEQ
jgi:hypothetical protein